MSRKGPPPRAGQAGQASPSSRPGNLLACLLLLAAGVVAYWNSFEGGFVFDDRPAILDNPTLRHLWPLGPVLNPPGGGLTVQGRPLVNLSLAVNWAIGQEKVFGYHVVNLAIHLAAALLLFGIIRRTLLQKRFGERFVRSATGIALSAALLWTIHPLQTESVTYIVQRAESMMALFYLLTLYCVIRGAGSCRPASWYALSVLACLAGMATKEVMVSAPLVVLLYDRIFLAGSFKEAFRRRWALYVALACTWGLLAYVVAGSAGRGGTAGFGLKVNAGQYILTEMGILLHYLRLCFWPSGLVLDYGWPLARNLGQILPGLLVAAALLAATIWALVRRPAMGFLGACFFLILAPTTCVPLVDAAFEHRMYLPLAAVIVLVVLLLHQAWQWLRGRVPALSRAALGKLVPLAAVGLVASLLVYGTLQRNKDYRSELVMWQDVVAKRPENPRAWYSLGGALGRVGRVQDAIPLYETALHLKPDFADGEFYLADALARAGRSDEAMLHVNRALQMKPDSGEAQSLIGSLLARAGKPEEAVMHLSRALQLMPDDAQTENNLGSVLANQGHLQEAVAHFERAVQLDPNSASARAHLAQARSSLAK